MKKYSKYLIAIIIIFMIGLGLKLYTNYVFDNLNNETPREAIVEFVYEESHSWKSFFIDVEEYDYEDKKDDNLYYRIKYNGHSIPKQLGGTIEVKEDNNHYYVTKYLGY